MIARVDQTYQHIKEVHRMRKSISYVVFKGYNPRQFLFFNKELKNQVVLVDVTDL